MRGLLLIPAILLLSACATTQVEVERIAHPEEAMRDNFTQSAVVRLADAELALTRFDAKRALGILDELEGITNNWKKTSPSEDVALGWLTRQANEIRFIATIFGAGDQPDKLKELYAADPDRLIERFIGDGSTMQSAACYQLYAISGRSEEAERGYGRVLALLEGRQNDVRRFRLMVVHASTLAGMNLIEQADAEHHRLTLLLAEMGLARVQDLREYASYCLLPALMHARREEYAEASKLMTDWFKEVPEHLAKPRLDKTGTALKELADTWAAEKERWAKEPADLPKVEIETDKGKMVITLFEDDCPNTVASFIALVEKGLYDGTLFHRVVPHFVVQGGDPVGTGSGGPGYAIKREATRLHFRGSIGMARDADPDSAGSQFYFCLNAATTHHLDNGYCVFGRVSLGLDVMDQLRLGSKIIKARVLNKRTHEYKVERLPVKE
jgi:peptidyl-prolyl cis-trans isomerase B (cyclophilin B)